MVQQTQSKMVEQADRAQAELMEWAERPAVAERHCVAAMQIKTTAISSGLTSMPVYEWLQDIELTRPYFLPFTEIRHISQ